MISLQGFFVAATLVTLVQWVRLRRRSLLPLLALFVCLTLAHSQTDWFAARPYHIAAGLAGLVLLGVLCRRAPAS